MLREDIQVPKAPAFAEEIPNAIISEVTAKRFNAQGELQSQLYAPEIIHFQKQASARLKNPRFILYDAKEKPWTIIADEADAKDNQSVIVLRNHVQLTQPAGLNNPEIVITTSELILHPKDNTAETTKPIKLQEKAKDNSITLVNAVGAKANQKTGIVELLSEARGYYAATS